MTNLVYLKDGKGKTDSLAIAREFGKQHKDVLRKINECVHRLPSEWGMRNFTPTQHTDPQNNQTYTKYELTRDGWMFLVMGFTGKKADSIKLLFIEEFNRMEETLLSYNLQHSPLSIDYLLSQAEERAVRAEALLTEEIEAHRITRETALIGPEELWQLRLAIRVAAKRFTRQYGVRANGLIKKIIKAIFSDGLSESTYTQIAKADLDLVLFYLNNDLCWRHLELARTTGKSDREIWRLRVAIIKTLPL